MNNQVIFDNLEIDRCWKSKDKHTGGIGLLESNKYPLFEVQNNCQMVSFKDPLDGVLIDFMVNFF